MSWFNDSPTGRMVFSWLKVFAATVLGLFLADGADIFAVDGNDLRAWLAVALSSLLPVIINYINPGDDRYGVNANVGDDDDIEIIDEEEIL